MDCDIITATATSAFPHAASRKSTYSGVCQGTLGELIQGPVMRDGEAQIGLISLPVKRYSWVHFTAGEAGDIGADLAAKSRCRHAVALYLRRHGLSLPAGRWSHDSELPEGKGMASSTADLVATIRCLDALFGRSSTPAAIADLLREVERSDSVFLDEYALYLSGLQTVVQRFDARPQFHVCYVDEGGVVDTERSGPALLAYYRAQAEPYRRNLERTIDAFERGDTVEIAHCATRSAELAQGVAPKRTFDAMQAQRAALAADGIVVAHTGSLIGYLFATRPDSARMGTLSAFFRGLGFQCRFVHAGF